MIYFTANNHRQQYYQFIWLCNDLFFPSSHIFYHLLSSKSPLIMEVFRTTGTAICRFGKQTIHYDERIETARWTECKEHLKKEIYILRILCWNEQSDSKMVKNFSYFWRMSLIFFSLFWCAFPQCRCHDCESISYHIHLQPRTIQVAISSHGQIIALKDQQVSGRIKCIFHRDLLIYPCLIILTGLLSCSK